MEKTYSPSEYSHLLIRHFPEIENMDFMKLEKEIDPKFEGYFSVYANFYKNVVASLLKGSLIDGISIQKVANFMNDSFNGASSDILLVNVIGTEWYQPLASTILHFRDEFNTECLESFTNLLTGKALQYLNFQLGKAPAPEFE